MEQRESATLRRQALGAGALYLLVVLIAPIGIVYVASELVHQVIEVFLTLALYRLFKPVKEDWAKQMLLLGLVPIPIMFANMLNEIAATVLLGGYAFLAPFSAEQIEVLAYLFMRLHAAGITVASIFWGLWLLPLGALLWRAAFGSRVVGVLVAIAGCGYTLDAFVKLVVPWAAAYVSTIAPVLEAGELAVVAWLLAVGARVWPRQP